MNIIDDHHGKLKGKGVLKVSITQICSSITYFPKIEYLMNRIISIEMFKLVRIRLIQLFMVELTL